LAPIVRLDDQTAREARRGRTLRYIELAKLGPDYFVDLGTVASAENGYVVAEQRTPGVDNDIARHELRQRIGRRYSRYAFPASLVPMFGTLQSKVRDKSDKTDSNFGRALDMLATIRVGVAGGWDSEPPWELNLILVVKDGYLPADPDPPQSLGNSEITLDAASDYVIRAPLATADALIGWHQLASTMRREVLKKSPGVGLVQELTVEVTDEADFSYLRLRRTVSLDLDDLSPPLG